jgi:hypothetical protein
LINLDINIVSQQGAELPVLFVRVILRDVTNLGLGVIVVELGLKLLLLMTLVVLAVKWWR